MKEKEGKPKRPLKVMVINGLNIGPKQLIEQQKNDETLKRYWEMVDKPKEGKPQFVIKNGILYRRYEKFDEIRIQLMVPSELRDKVVMLAHDTLLSGHRGASETLKRVQQEFYWPGIHNFVTRYVASCDICQRNVPKGTVAKAPMGKLPIIGTPFATVCVDIIGPITCSSDGHRYIITLIDMCTRYPEAVPLKNIDTCAVAEALLAVLSSNEVDLLRYST